MRHQYHWNLLSILFLEFSQHVKHLQKKFVQIKKKKSYEVVDDT